MLLSGRVLVSGRCPCCGATRLWWLPSGAVVCPVCASKKKKKVVEVFL